jgi:hypothetical protein
MGYLRPRAGHLEGVEAGADRRSALKFASIIEASEPTPDHTVAASDAMSRHGRTVTPQRAPHGMGPDAGELEESFRRAGFSTMAFRRFPPLFRFLALWGYIVEARR